MTSRLTLLSTYFACVFYVSAAYRLEEFDASPSEFFYINGNRAPEVVHGDFWIPSEKYSANDAISYRQQGIFGGIFSNRFPNSNGIFNTFMPSFVSPIIRNPNAPAGPFSLFAPCTASDGHSGICVNAASCALNGGRSSGFCGIGNVCCINTISTCSGTATLNNTYFQSPAKLDNPSLCSLTVKLDKRLPQQKFAICQLRLDFVSFSIAQPAQGGATAALQAQATQCLTDSFQVGGTLNTVPTICGDNNDQHMYLHVPPSDKQASDVRLTFNIGSSSISRSWKIKVAMLPCGANYLAPSDCLQYFTSVTGKVSSFNWADAVTAGDSVRQLANQNYAICFRTEIVEANKRGQSICFTECSTANGGDGFLLSGLTDATALSSAESCPRDYILLACAVPVSGSAFAERYCGNYFNTDDTKSESMKACTDAMPYEMHYVTDGSEGFAAGAATEAKNTGFCLNFEQRSVGKSAP